MQAESKLYYTTGTAKMGDMRLLLPLLSGFLLASCLGIGELRAQQYKQTTPLYGNQPQVDTRELGQRIWQNECAGSVQGLVSWNAGESFPSLGIGHFIWYPAGVQEAFDESFPTFVRYARARGVQVPVYFDGQF